MNRVQHRAHPEVPTLNLRRSLAILFSLLLIAATFAAPALGHDHPGESGDDDTDSSHSSHPSDDARDNGSANGSSNGNGEDAREFHEEQQEEREEFLAKQAAEREAFLDELAEDCLNRTEWNESYRDDLSEECEERLVNFLHEQQQDRVEFFQNQSREQREWAEDQRRDWEESHARPDHARGPESLGSFSTAGDHVDGRYVSFNYSLAPLTISSLRVTGTPLLDEVTLTGESGDAEAGFHGARFYAESDAGELMLHDNPSLALMLEPDDDGHATLDVADYLTVTGEGERWSATDGGNVTLMLLFDEEPTYDETTSTFTTTEEVRVLTRGGTPDGGADQARIHRAVEDRHVGAELTLVGDNGSVLDETILYEDLNVTFEEKRNGHVRFVVDGELPTGRTILLNVDHDVFQDADVEFRYYDVEENGTVEVPIRAANGIQDALNPNDDSTPEYYLGQGANGMQVLVTVPHFSAHVVEIQSVLQEAPPSVLAGILAAVGFLGIAAGNLFKDRIRRA